ncbi:MAG: hypothetical protein ACLGJA_08850 [Gammaproteobacteria bacterium]
MQRACRSYSSTLTLRSPLVLDRLIGRIQRMALNGKLGIVHPR